MIPLFKVFMSQSAASMTAEVLNSGYIGQGPKVDEFENALKQFFRFNNIVSTNSATSSLHLALHMLRREEKNQKQDFPVLFNSHWPGISHDDEVLTTPLTCTATNWPILLNNYKIKWVDVCPHSCNMDLDDLERKISSKTKAIVVVHWGGNPVDIDRLRRIQENAYDMYGFTPAIIEDCAHAFGSTFNSHLLGTTGNIATYSFQAIKHLTSVDGGCILFPHRSQVLRARLLRWYGIDREQNRKDFRCENDIPEPGFKMHMNDVNAAVGLANLPEVASIVVPRHIDNARFYNSELASVPGLQVATQLPNTVNASWLYTVFVENQAGFFQHLTNNGIQVSRVHERNDKHTCIQPSRSLLPGTDKAVKTMACIPVGWWVTDEQRQYIVDVIKAGW